MTTTPVLRYAVAAVLASLAPACEHKTDCADCGPPKRAPTAATAGAAAHSAKLAPWQTVHDGFDACAGGCGTRATGPIVGVIAQPGAAVGQGTYCPVSGVAFEIKATSVHRRVGQQILYFCCEACAAYFTANQAAILAARGIAG